MPQRLARTQPTEWHRVGNQIDAAFIAAGADFVNVLIHSLAQYHVAAENREIIYIGESHFTAQHRLIEPLFYPLNFADLKM